MSTDDFLTRLRKKETSRLEPALEQYNDYHKARFDYVVGQCRAICPDASSNVLDVGRSALTLQLLQHYDTVSTLGFRLGPNAVTGLGGPDGTTKPIKQHIVYDLNTAQTMKSVETDERFDLVVFAEVLEHLYTAPELTLFSMKSVMKPGGYLVVQTPNAAALHKRLLLLMGRNPYELIRINPFNPGHFREHTKKELIAFAEKLEMDVVRHDFVDYFALKNGLAEKLVFLPFKGIVALVPSFARGQTMILRKRT